MEVSLLIPLFNRLDLTRACLESLERTLRRWHHEVILIDDGSTDGTRDFLRTLPAPHYRVVLNDAPLGYAANNNLAARLARAPLLCLLNNDTVLRPRWLEPMARAASLLPGVGFVGNVQREPVGGLIDHHGIFFDHDGIPHHAGKNRPLAPAEPYLEWPAVTAACCVVRRRAFLKLGGFDEAFRNGFEDVDLCLRAHERGYRHFVANRSEIFHHVSASPGRKQAEEANLRRFLARWRERITHPFRQRQPTGSSRRLPVLPRTLFQWEDTLHRATVARWLKPLRKTDSFGLQAPVFLVGGATAQTPACDGVSTVVRKLAGALGRLRAPVRLSHWQSDAQSLALLPPEFSLGQDAERLRETPASWARQASLPSLFEPTAARPEGLFTRATPLHQLPPADLPPPGSWVVLPEILPGEDAAPLVDYVHRHGWRLAVVLHDLLATNEPAFFPPDTANALALYLRAVSDADLVLPVSDFTARDWQLFVANKALPFPPVRTCKLAADTFGGPRTALPPRREPGAPVRLLCVSAVAPRKGHRALLAAYELAASARPDLALELRFVGAHRPGGDGLDAALHAAMARHPGRVTWHEQVEHSTLRRCYEACDFTVYPSVLEGFGLPILESLWCRRACVCANFGAMDEVAWSGGCVVTDVRDPQTLADTILSLATDPPRLAELGTQIDGRGLRVWEEYARDLLAALAQTGNCPQIPQVSADLEKAAEGCISFK